MTVTKCNKQKRIPVVLKLTIGSDCCKYENNPPPENVPTLRYGSDMELLAKQMYTSPREDGYYKEKVVPFSSLYFKKVLSGVYAL